MKESLSSTFSVPEAYERYIGRWSARLAPGFLSFAGARDGERLLDVGCGTGSLSLALAAAAPSAEIEGIDPSSPFVEYARSRPNAGRIKFSVGDAQALPYPDNAFDRSLAMLVFNFIPDPAKGLSEMRRVTRSGGVVATAVWDHFGGMKMLRTFWSVVDEIDPTADGENQPTFAKDSMYEMFVHGGLQDVRAEELWISTDFASFDDYWSPFLGGQGPGGRYVASLTPERREVLRQALRERVLGSKPDEAFSFGARAWAVRGVVPEA
ncbi:MAG TPA: methyltransferase domain-containing protein [Candidatus Eremiobacteraceae bacterium]|nr:methyltransferase domain-containing protein [Candidatus Eremiobacteraceae bacterium]